jgi:hypothetical protein
VELVGRSNSGSGLGNRSYGRRDPQKLALTSPTSGSCSVGVVRSRTKATDLLFLRYVGFEILTVVVKNVLGYGTAVRVYRLVFVRGVYFL